MRIGVFPLESLGFVLFYPFIFFCLIGFRGFYCMLFFLFIPLFQCVIFNDGKIQYNLENIKKKCQLPSEKS